MATDVYRNLLHKCVSVRTDGKVTHRVQNVLVTGVTFRVKPAGVQRIRRIGQREVVAYARGTVEAMSDERPFDLPAGAVPVHFNPFVHETFVLDDGTPVYRADVLIMTSPCGSYVLNPR